MTLEEAMKRNPYDPKKGIEMKTIVDTTSGFVLVDTRNTPDHGPETMVFVCDKNGNVCDWRDLDCMRYKTIPEAIKGHAVMIEKWRKR